MRGGVLVVGNAVLDIVVRPAPERLPFGESRRLESIEQALGGNGASTAYTLGRLGVPVRLLAPVGRDSFGAYLRKRLEEAGVDTSALEETEARTATSAVLVNAAGERALLHLAGASAEGFAGSIDLPGEGFRHLHLGTPFAVPRLRPRIAGLLAQAREKGLTTSIDTQWDSAGRWMEDLAPALPFTDLLFANKDEARMLTGYADAPSAAEQLLAAGAGAVIMKMGVEGCALFSGGVEQRFAAFPVQVMDTLGAGDCFVGGFLAALWRGCGMDQAAQFANAVAALSIQQVGATEGLLSWDETQAWITSAESVRPGSHTR